MASETIDWELHNVSAVIEFSFNFRFSILHTSVALIAVGLWDHCRLVWSSADLASIWPPAKAKVHLAASGFMPQFRDTAKNCINASAPPARKKCCLP